MSLMKEVRQTLVMGQLDAEDIQATMSEMSRLPSEMEPFVHDFLAGSDPYDLMQLAHLSAYCCSRSPSPVVAPSRTQPLRPAILLKDGKYLWYPDCTVHFEVVQEWRERTGKSLLKKSLVREIGAFGPDGHYYTCGQKIPDYDGLS